jgi:hypothetical protein
MKLEVARMAVGLDDLETILKLRRTGILPPKFSIAEIGAQQLGNNVLRDPDIMPAYAEAFGVPLRYFGPPPARRANLFGFRRFSQVEILADNAPSTTEFWNWLGCPHWAVDIVFQRHEDIPFVPPIDAHAGGVVDDQRIRSRYWTVFGGERPPG